MKALILGGVKSGKSRYAEQQALVSDRPVVLVATARADDEEMRQRIERHRVTRPAAWDVIEEPIRLVQALDSIQDKAATTGITVHVIVDCLTLWVTQLLCSEMKPKELEAACSLLVESVARFNGSITLVSNETNMGVMPMDALTRRYCDVIGGLHQQLATEVDQVTLMVAGLPLQLK